MIEIDIPSIDPIQHEAKIFLGMTSRQSVCLVPGLIAGGALFAVLFPLIGIDWAVMALVICVAPAVCMGWVKPYNMKFEDYVRLLYFNEFKQDKRRIYKTDTAEVVKMMTMEERQFMEKKQKEKQRKKKEGVLYEKLYFYFS